MKEYLNDMEDKKYRFAFVLWEMLKNVEEGRTGLILAVFILKLVRRGKKDGVRKKERSWMKRIWMIVLWFKSC